MTVPAGNFLITPFIYSQVVTFFCNPPTCWQVVTCPSPLTLRLFAYQLTSRSHRFALALMKRPWIGIPVQVVTTLLHCQPKHTANYLSTKRNYLSFFFVLFRWWSQSASTTRCCRCRSQFLIRRDPSASISLSRLNRVGRSDVVALWVVVKIVEA